MSWFEKRIQRRPARIDRAASEEKLLATVIANPDSDAPRWMIADYWLENGNPRGEFVAAQLARFEVQGGSPEAAELDARIDALLKAHKRTWVGRFKGARTEYGVEGGQQWAKGNPTHWTFARGFVQTAKMAAADFVANSAVLLDCEPVERVQLTQARHAMEGFEANVAHAERIRVLDLGRAKLEDKDLSALWGSTRLSGLTSLSLVNCRIGTRRFQRMLKNPRGLAGLRELRLAQNSLGDAAIVALAKHEGVAGLKELHLNWNNFGDKGARALLESPFLEGLEHLRVNGNSVSDALIDALDARFSPS